MAAGDLTTLANVQAWIPNLGSADATLLNRLITAESQRIQNWLARGQLASASYTETYDGKNTLSMPLKQFPITAVASLTVDGVSIPLAQPASPTNPAPSGYVFTDTMLSLVGGGWPFDQYRFTRGYQNVIVAYTAGYASGSNDFLILEQACIELIATRYMERQRIGQKSKSIAGEVVSFFTGDMPDSVKAMLKPYRRVVPR